MIMIIMINVFIFTRGHKAGERCNKKSRKNKNAVVNIKILKIIIYY